jgi:hypothetical protein
MGADKIDPRSNIPGQLLDEVRVGWTETGPNPMDHKKKGSKNHLLWLQWRRFHPSKAIGVSPCGNRP